MMSPLEWTNSSRFLGCPSKNPGQLCSTRLPLGAQTERPGCHETWVSFLKVRGGIPSLDTNSQKTLKTYQFSGALAVGFREGMSLFCMVCKPCVIVVFCVLFFCWGKITFDVDRNSWESSLFCCCCCLRGDIIGRWIYLGRFGRCCGCCDQLKSSHCWSFWMLDGTKWVIICPGDVGGNHHLRS